MSHNQDYHRHQPRVSHQGIKTATAVTIGGSLIALSGLILSATVIGLVLATPVLVIFSPVLVPALVTLGLIFSGFLASGGMGVTATVVFYWMYRRYVTGKLPVGSSKVDMARDKAGQLGHQMKMRLTSGGGGQSH